ncbi:unnamed protein product [Closterium sp. NIES-53]
MFSELFAFATVEDLVTHLRTSDGRYRAALPAEFLERNPPPMYITLSFIVTRLPDSLRAVRDHFLALDPTALTIDLLEQHLFAVETSVVTIGATLSRPFVVGDSVALFHITVPRLLGFVGAGTCSNAQTVLTTSPMWLTLQWFVIRLSSARDVLLQKHPSELAIERLKSTLTKIESNLLSVASATAAVVPRLFEMCAVPQLQPSLHLMPLLRCLFLRRLQLFLPLEGRNEAREVREGGRVCEN